MAEIGLFPHQDGALLDRLVREPSEMVRKTSVQTMVAEWRRFLRRVGVVSVRNKELTS